MVKIIVAYDPNRVIGKNGTLPWSLPEDMAHFKKTTIGHVVVMGYKTYASIKMPVLPKRDNIVITRDFAKRQSEFQEKYPNAVNSPIFVSSLDEALRAADFIYPKKEVFIIGGSSIYDMALKSGSVDELIITKVNDSYEGDTYFPEIPNNYVAYPAEGYTSSDKFTILLYKKVTN